MINSRRIEVEVCYGQNQQENDWLRTNLHVAVRKAFPDSDITYKTGEDGLSLTYDFPDAPGSGARLTDIASIQRYFLNDVCSPKLEEKLK